jgi:hypothetical protein
VMCKRNVCSVRVAVRWKCCCLVASRIFQTFSSMRFIIKLRHGTLVPHDRFFLAISIPFCGRR